MEKKIIKVALSGNPNSGKSSLFNHLTGLQQKVTNIPGTTIERKIGYFQVDDTKIQIHDTPGTYSLNAKSVDEEVALEIYGLNSTDKPDIILYVADATNLKRHLFFFAQLTELKIPMVLVLNMMDVATWRGIEYDLDRFEKELGVRVLVTNARLGEGLIELKAALLKPQFIPHHLFSAPEKKADGFEDRYGAIDKLLAKVQNNKNSRQLLTAKIDPILTHPLWGYLIFIGVLLIIFQSVFKLAEYPMGLIESAFDAGGKALMQILPAGWIRSLLVNGVVAGLAGVIVFIPQIAILFFFMAILEDTGYMARISFIMDRMLRSLGLNGKSVMPLLGGAACAIPAIMATRNIENWKDRMITIMVTPLMSCSARLPVYTLLISLAVPESYVLGIFSMKGIALLIMYLIGTIASLVAALVFKMILKQRSLNFFIMELPIYHPPRWQNIWMTVWLRCKSFVTEAGKIIILVSVILWFLASYGPSKQPESHVFNATPTENLNESYAGYFGKAIEPAIEPIGFNWKIGIALLTSFAAREVFVGTMSTIYSVDDSENIANIREKMQAEINPITQKPVYNLAVVFSLMIFYAFAMQCFSTLAVVYKETKQLKWPVIQFVYMTALAYVSSFAVYNLLS